MILFWRIRYHDSADKQFKDRDLWLDTASLDPTLRAKVELCNELRESGDGREMLQYRHLFKEKSQTEEEMSELVKRAGRFDSVFIHDYFEDEHGNEMRGQAMAKAVTGSDTAILFPPGSKQHDIDFALAEKRPIAIDQLAVTPEQLSVLGYFSRDMRQMVGTAFFKDGPGTLSYSGNDDGLVQTAVTNEEIDSFVMIFRRLYMTKDPANFLHAVGTYADVVGDHPIVAWVKGNAAEYEKNLGDVPHFVPHASELTDSFTCKRIIDVFLYTRYAHQPDPRRQRQYDECLSQLNGRSGLLFWLFLMQLQKCACHMRNAGQMIVKLYDCLCEQQGVVPPVLKPVSDEHPTIGTLEKRKDREIRLRREKTEELADALWREGGCPEGGPEEFMQQAQEQLDTPIAQNGSHGGHTT